MRTCAGFSTVRRLLLCLPLLVTLVPFSSGEAHKAGTLMPEGSLAATEAPDTARVSMRAWATPADDRCFARTVCLEASLRDQDTKACRSWQ
jgi:hypothetical protein